MDNMDKYYYVENIVNAISSCELDGVPHENDNTFLRANKLENLCGWLEHCRLRIIGVCTNSEHKREYNSVVLFERTDTFEKCWIHVPDSAWSKWRDEYIQAEKGRIVSKIPLENLKQLVEIYENMAGERHGSKQI